MIFREDLFLYNCLQCFPRKAERDPGNDFYCECPDGFEGLHCENNIDDCLGVTCPADKMCYDGVAGYECSCPPGLSGDDCAQQIDDCQGDPCQNGGHCQDLLEGYRLV